MISPRTVIRGAHIPPLPRRRTVRMPALGAWRRLEPLHIAWLAVWAPWWVGNELPPPSLPRGRDTDMAELPGGTAGAWMLDTLDDLKFRFGLAWAAALVMRGAWLGGLAGIGWLVLAMVSGVPSPSFRQLVIPVAVGIALGLVLRLFHRPRYGSIALLLERSFDLRSRLATAVGGLRYGETGHGTLHELQLADAANALDRTRSRLRPVHWVPVREIFLVFIVAMTLLLLLVARRPEGEIPPVSTTGLPSFVPVSERLAAAEQQPVVEPPDAATLQEVEDISRTSNQARQDLEAIGEALDGNALTEPAANAIASENYPAANQELSEASESVSQLPAGEREALADELDEAAERVSEENPELAESASDAADDARAGEDSGALDELGEQIENTGESVISQEASGGELSETSSGQQGEQQSGAPGGSSSESGEQQEPSDGGSGEAEAGSEGDPGAGMDASSGVGSSEESGEQPGSGGTGQEGGDSPSTSGDGTTGQESQDGGSSSSGQAESGEPSSDASGDSGNMSGRPDEEDGESQGSGAGGGQTDANDPNESDDSGGGGGDLDNEDESPEAGDGEAGDPPPGGPEDEGSGGESTTASGGSSIMLPGTSGERVSSGSDIGSSSVGSGGGVGAGAGDSTSSVSGSSGPDPNDVPIQWRTIVEDYFRDGGAP